MKKIESIRLDETRQSAVPWWAAFGAPLVGVPLLVGLLALGSPQAPEEAPVPGGEASFTQEQVEPPPPAPMEWVAGIHEVPVPEAGSRC